VSFESKPINIEEKYNKMHIINSDWGRKWHTFNRMCWMLCRIKTLAKTLSGIDRQSSGMLWDGSRRTYVSWMCELKCVIPVLF